MHSLLGLTVLGHESVYASLAPLKTSPLLPRCDCWSAASALPSGQSSLGSGSSQYEGSWCTPVYTGALQSAWYAGDPCLRDQKYDCFFYTLTKMGAATTGFQPVLRWWLDWFATFQRFQIIFPYKYRPLFSKIKAIDNNRYYFPNHRMKYMVKGFTFLICPLLLFYLKTNETAPTTPLLFMYTDQPQQ